MAETLEFMSVSACFLWVCYGIISRDFFSRKRGKMNGSEKTFITLAQFLKKTGIAATGGQAKYLVKELEITVNGDKEDRRGRKLYSGDEVVIDGRKYTVE